MFSIYDNKPFSVKLRTLRKSMNYTIADVSNMTGIYSGTIKLLESGKSTPRFDTLVHLSSLYKCDLLSIFRKCYKDSISIFLLNDISENFIDNNQEALDDALIIITEHLNSGTLLPIDFIDLQQLRIYIEGLKFASNCHSATCPENDVALKKYEEAIKMTNKFFSYDYFEKYKYNALEYNILFSVAIIIGLKRDCLLSNKILYFALDYYIQNDDIIDVHRHRVSKIYYALSYNYHRLDLHEKALETAEKGIAYCVKSDTYKYAPMLLARKGIALHNLSADDWRDALVKAIHFLDVQKRYTLKESYEQILIKLDS